MFEQEYTRANDRIHPRKDLLKEMEAKWAAEAEKPAEETGKVIPFPSWIRYAAVAAGIVLCVGVGMGSVMLFTRDRGREQKTASAEAPMAMDSVLFEEEPKIITEPAIEVAEADGESEDTAAGGMPSEKFEMKLAAAAEAPRGMHAALDEAEVEDAVRHGALERATEAPDGGGEIDAEPPTQENAKSQPVVTDAAIPAAAYGQGTILQRDQLMAVFLPTTEQVQVVQYDSKKLTDVFSLTLREQKAQVKRLFWMDDQFLAVREHDGETELLRFGVADWKTPTHLRDLSQSGTFLGAEEMNGRLYILSLYAAAEEEPLPWVDGSRMDYTDVWLDRERPGDTFTVITVYDPKADSFVSQWALLAESRGVAFGHEKLLLWTEGAETTDLYAITCKAEGLSLGAEATRPGTCLSAGEVGEGFTLLLQQGKDVALWTADGALNEVEASLKKGAGAVRWGQAYEGGAAYLTADALHWITAAGDVSLEVIGDAFQWLTVDRALVYTADGRLQLVAMNDDGLALLDTAQVRDSLELLVEDPSRLAFDAITGRLVFPAGQKVYQYRVSEQWAFGTYPVIMSFSDQKDDALRELRCLLTEDRALIFYRDGVALCNENLSRLSITKY